MKKSVVYTSEGRLNTKSQRQRDLKVQAASYGETYKSNTTKEELALEYISSFIQQFCAIHKERKIPYMVAENELGVKKFVCTTIRPTLLPIPELYDLAECASFLAGYIMYEPLDSPNQPPKFLFSPAETLNSYTGDSFDMAMLLCSFLLGSGFNAYVVCGYAPEFITLKDQSQTKCPMMTDNSAVSSFEKLSKNRDDSEATDGPESSELSNTYVPPDNTVKNSKFLAEEAEKRRISALDTFKLWLADQSVDEGKMMGEMRSKSLDFLGTPAAAAALAAAMAHPAASGKAAAKIGNKTKHDLKLQHQRQWGMHAWVLVRPWPDRKENREPTLPTFIEPSTGRLYGLNNSPYIAIESVWNNSNYWVSNQFETPMENMSYDLENDKMWEQLFYTGNQEGGENKDNEEQNNEDRDFMDEPANAEGEVTNSQANDAGRFFDAPPTWSNALALPRKKYLLKYPPVGKRSVQYYCTKADFFARRVHNQCMVMRITTYLDAACTVVNEVHEWFEGRHDKMYKRIRYFLDNRRFVEFYHPGSFDEVKKWTEYPGKVIEVDFHVGGRLDRLARREETIGQSIVEFFQGRSDFLTYRSVLLTSDRHIVGSRQLPLPSGSHGMDLMAVKMTQQYEPDHSQPEGTDVAKRVFYVSEGKAVFYFHFGKSKITGDIKTFLHARGPSIPVMSEQALAQEIGVDDNQDALQMAGSLERDCYSSIKSSVQQFQKLREQRREVEGRIDYERTVFERALDTADNSSASRRDSMADALAAVDGAGAGDYLSPFLRSVGNANELTKEEALEIRQACLDALKARLVERANIIQTKLHEENAALGKTQELFQRAQREGEFDTQKYEDTCTKAMFRIQILEQRLAAHEEAALRKFGDLDMKLSMDQRLKVLRT